MIDRLDDGPALQRAWSQPFRRAFRVHPRRGKPCGWGRLEPVPWHGAGRFHTPDRDPGRQLDYHTGCIYPQDAASQVPAGLLDVQPGDVVIDACAAPGSKSSQLGLALGDTGVLLCCDVSAPRRRALRENLQRQGIASALVTPLGLDRLAGQILADAVLVDAPCSGHDERSPKQVMRQAKRQLGILVQAAALLRPGGRLVYSTCTPYRDENEGVIARFLEQHSDVQVQPRSLSGCDPDMDQLGAIRLWPQRQGTEPFFACRLQRSGTGSMRLPFGECPPVWSGELPAGLAGLHVWQRNERVFAAPEAVASLALPSEARGLLLGRQQGGRLDLDPWAVQALIERGAPAAVISHQQACASWAGTETDLPCGYVKTEQGAPLGISDGRRLVLPSRLRRSTLC